ncbi:MAG TPA: response regulator [Candidatus Saccharimonadales bacterium]|nr:response regulator [Candidatus Saccharimonadales bacterium]
MKKRELLVMVVETERPLAYLFQLDLAQHGHRVNVVHSAEHALKVLTPKYDLVVTSLDLPDMSGEQFLLKMRARVGYADIPVLVIAPDAELPPSIRDDATQLRRKPFDLAHFVRYATDAAGPSRFPN